MSSELYERIYAAVRQIPFGKVTSYGQIAKQAGLFRGARVVGWALGNLPVERTDVPWQRVVNRLGQLSIVNPQATPDMQQQLLEKEGVPVSLVKDVLTVGPNAWWNTGA